MRKKSKIWEELQEQIVEAEKDKAIKEMRKHPGVLFIPSGTPIPTRLDTAALDQKDEESPPPAGDPKVNSLLAKIKELTQK
jgi:hypothetical protein